MNLREELQSELSNPQLDQIKSNMRKITSSYAMPLEFIDASITSEGVIVTYLKLDTEEFEVIFLVEDNKPKAVTIIEEDENGEVLEHFETDLTGLVPTIMLREGVYVVDFSNITWLTEDVMFDILNEDDEGEEIEEASTYVVRNGKKIKKKLVRKRRRKKLSSKARAGIRKAVIKRRSQKGAIGRKRKKANKLRKRLGLKKNTNSRLKVQGTSSGRR